MISCSYLDKASISEAEKQKDSIGIWLQQAEDTIAGEKLPLLEKAYRAVTHLRNDTVKTKYLVDISYQYSKTDSDIAFRKVNKEAIQLADKLGDSLSLTDAYWDLGDHFSKAGKNDSAYYSYYQAQQIYEKLEDDFSSAQMLINMAIRQINGKDYTGSEIITTKAINLINSKNYEQLYSCYNNLGIIYNRLGDYDKSIEYYNKALYYLIRSGMNNLEPITINNIGVVYKNQEKYEESIEKYKEAQHKNDLYAKDPKWKAVFIDNIAYARFKLDDNITLPDEFFEALQIRKELNDISGIITNNLHLAEYYAAQRDTINALKYANDAKKLAETSSNFGDLLEALLWLSRLDNNDKSVTYLNDYIRLSDSLQQTERILRDKFARIRFETDELITINKKIKRELIFLYYTLLGITAFGGLLFIIIVQRNRNRKLRLEQERQDIDLRTYNLLLNEQSKIEEGRREERKRISEELHDGVLGKLFGTRLMLDNLNSRKDKPAITLRKKYVKDLQDIEREIRGVSHELNTQSRIVQKGFIILVDDFLETHSKISRFTFSKRGDNTIDWEAIPGIIKANLYRIIQEAIQNINKYAKASAVDIAFSINKDGLSIIIRDNGVGFNIEEGTSGIGLDNMRSRMGILGGKIFIESFPNKGTKINITVPVNL